jgi:hypothetical protein
MATLAVAEGAAQSAHLDLEIRLFDVRFRPGPRDQFLFADHLAGALDQSRQNVKGAAAEPDRLIALEQKSLHCKEPKRSERNRVSVHGGVKPFAIPGDREGCTDLRRLSMFCPPSLGSIGIARRTRRDSVSSRLCIFAISRAAILVRGQFGIRFIVGLAVWMAMLHMQFHLVERRQDELKDCSMWGTG